MHGSPGFNPLGPSARSTNAWRPRRLASRERGQGECVLPQCAYRVGSGWELAHGGARWHRAARRLWVVAGLLGGQPAWAQEVETPSAERGPSSLEGPLWLEVSTPGFELDARRVARAVAFELDMPLTRDEHAASMTVRVVATAGQQLRVVVSPHGGLALERSVAAPQRADEVGEVAALLAANLARDESVELLASLEASERPSQARSGTDPAAQKLERDWLHVSFFHPVSWPAPPSEVVAEVALLHGSVGALSGLSLSGGAERVEGYAAGLQAAGAANLNAAGGAGVRVAGALNWGGADYHGLSAAGAVELSGGALSGVQAAGAVALAGGLAGLQVAGGFAGAERATGLQLAAGAVASQRAAGLQVAGGVALADELEGVQLALLNIADGVSGAQIGIVNIAGDVEGAQIGIVNIARDVRGASVGAATLSETGELQLVAWYDSSLPSNLGLRMYTGLFYAMPTLGYDPRESELNYVPGLSVGVRLRPYSQSFLDFETNVAQPSDGRNYDEHSLQLRYRALLGYQLTQGFGLFAGGGVLHSFRTDRKEESVSPEVSLGVQVF